MLSRKIARAGAYLVLGLTAAMIALALLVAFIDFFRSRPDIFRMGIGITALMVGVVVVWMTMPRREPCPNCRTGMLNKRYLREMENGSIVDEAYCRSCGHVSQVILRPADRTTK